MTELRIVASRQEALAAWDKKGVIVREEDGYVFVYPLLGKGIKYPDFDLRRECCLNTFMSVEGALPWIKSKGYGYHIVR